MLPEKAKEASLFRAIEQNSMKRLEFLLSIGFNVDAENDKGERLIEILTRTQNLEGVKILLKHNADFTVKFNKLGEFSKFIPHLVKKSNTKLKDLIKLEMAFFDEDFRTIDIILDMDIIIDESPTTFIKSIGFINHDKDKYIKFLEEFVKLKLEVLEVSHVKNDKEALAGYIKKLEILNEFLEEYEYFTNKPVKMFLEKIINGYHTTESLSTESFTDFEEDYLKKYPVDLTGEEFSYS
ncbi:hypothetical protein [Rickettsia endosymbiont of Halotydeus destructor]|uniref:hypothetical protein n=1 Tax=Rickettsia endosymbiont of Halotydeus destructor TaxID=2996754 RepID=UPI003BAFA511